MKKAFALLLAGVLLAGCTAAPAPGSKGELILATTTSTQDSGLLDVLKPEFEKQTGYTLKIIAVGTGQALAMGQKGEADAILAHAPASEKPLVDDGTVINYHQVMHNDFILVGPASDPAGIKTMKSAADAMKAIAAKGAVFVSRGDNSGTNSKELELWKLISVKPDGNAWYLKSGTGMGQTLTIASEKVGYTLTDRATYLAQQKNLKLDILVQGDAPLLNIYHVMQVNPAKFPKVKADGGKAFVDFMMKQETQQLVNKFGVDKYGQQLFFADALGK